MRVRFRRGRLPLVLLLAATLLWAQIAAAAHAQCLAGNLLPAFATQQDAGHCAEDAPAPAHADIDCGYHCAQGEPRADTLRLPELPHLGAALIPAAPATLDPPATRTTPAGDAVHDPPRAAWHRPTPHPASLLLI